MAKIFNKGSLKALGNGLKKSAGKHAPTLMLVGATIGVCVTVYEALKAKPKIDDILEERKKQIEELDVVDPGEEPLTEEQKKDEIRKINIDATIKVGKVAAKPIAAFAATEGFMWVSHVMNLRRLADMSGLASISSEALRRYKEANKEVIGPTKEAEVGNLAAQKEIDETFDPDKVLNSGQGDVIFKDPYSGRYFKSTRTEVERGFMDILKELAPTEAGGGGQDFVEQNELYDRLGLEDTTFGSTHGFDANDPNHRLSFTYGCTPDGIPCAILHYEVSMKYDRYGDSGTYLNNGRYSV